MMKALEWWKLKEMILKKVIWLKKLKKKNIDETIRQNA